MISLKKNVQEFFLHICRNMQKYAGSPRQLVDSYSQSKALHGYSLCHTNGSNVNNTYGIRHVQREQSSKLVKYIFCSVLYSFILNDLTGGGSFFQHFREARLRFQSRNISDVQSTFILAFFHLLTHTYAFLDQEPSAAPYCRPPSSLQACFLLWVMKRKKDLKYHSYSVLDLNNSEVSLVPTSCS